jgi:hypothetical protein
MECSNFPMVFVFKPQILFPGGTNIDADPSGKRTKNIVYKDVLEA